MKQVQTLHGMLPMDGVQESKIDKHIEDARKAKDFFMLDMFIRVKEANYLHIIDHLEKDRDALIKERDMYADYIGREYEDSFENYEDTHICHVEGITYEPVSGNIFKQLRNKYDCVFMGHEDEVDIGYMTFDNLLVLLPGTLEDESDFLAQKGLPKCFLESGAVEFDLKWENDFQLGQHGDGNPRLVRKKRRSILRPAAVGETCKCGEWEIEEYGSRCPSCP